MKLTFRERLADWITGGSLSHARREMAWGWIEAIRRADQLQRIAAMETPNCAPIGKRMAKAARDALK